MNVSANDVNAWTVRRLGGAEALLSSPSTVALLSTTTTTTTTEAVSAEQNSRSAPSISSMPEAATSQPPHRTVRPQQDSPSSSLPSTRRIVRAIIDDDVEALGNELTLLSCFDEEKKGGGGGTTTPSSLSASVSALGMRRPNDTCTYSTSAATPSSSMATTPTGAKKYSPSRVDGGNQMASSASATSLLLLSPPPPTSPSVPLPSTPIDTLPPSDDDYFGGGVAVAGSVKFPNIDVNGRLGGSSSGGGGGGGTGGLTMLQYACRVGSAGVVAYLLGITAIGEEEEEENSNCADGDDDNAESKKGQPPLANDATALLAKMQPSPSLSSFSPPACSSSFVWRRFVAPRDLTMAKKEETEQQRQQQQSTCTCGKSPSPPHCGLSPLISSPLMANEERCRDATASPPPSRSPSPSCPQPKHDMCSTTTPDQRQRGGGGTSSSSPSTTSPSLPSPAPPTAIHFRFRPLFPTPVDIYNQSCGAGSEFGKVPNNANTRNKDVDIGNASETSGTNSGNNKREHGKGADSLITFSPSPLYLVVERIVLEEEKLLEKLTTTATSGSGAGRSGFTDSIGGTPHPRRSLAAATTFTLSSAAAAGGSPIVLHRKWRRVAEEKHFSRCVVKCVAIIRMLHAYHCHHNQQQCDDEKGKSDRQRVKKGNGTSTAADSAIITNCPTPPSAAAAHCFSSHSPSPSATSYAEAIAETLALAARSCRLDVVRVIFEELLSTFPHFVTVEESRGSIGTHRGGPAAITTEENRQKEKMAVDWALSAVGGGSGVRPYILEELADIVATSFPHHDHHAQKAEQNRQNRSPSQPAGSPSPPPESGGPSATPPTNINPFSGILAQPPVPFPPALRRTRDEEDSGLMGTLLRHSERGVADNGNDDANQGEEKVNTHHPNNNNNNTASDGSTLLSVYRFLPKVVLRDCLLTAAAAPPRPPPPLAQHGHANWSSSPMLSPSPTMTTEDGVDTTTMYSATARWLRSREILRYLLRAGVYDTRAPILTSKNTVSKKNSTIIASMPMCLRCGGKAYPVAHYDNYYSFFDGGAAAAMYGRGNHDGSSSSSSAGAMGVGETPSMCSGMAIAQRLIAMTAPSSSSSPSPSPTPPSSISRLEEAPAASLFGLRMLKYIVESTMTTTTTATTSDDTHRNNRHQLTVMNLGEFVDPVSGYNLLFGCQHLPTLRYLTRGGSVASSASHSSFVTPNHTASDGVTTPLVYAVIHGWTDVVRYYVEGDVGDEDDDDENNVGYPRMGRRRRRGGADRGGEEEEEGKVHLPPPPLAAMSPFAGHAVVLRMANRRRQIGAPTTAVPINTTNWQMRTTGDTAAEEKLRREEESDMRLLRYLIGQGLDINAPASDAGGGGGGAAAKGEEGNGAAEPNTGAPTTTAPRKHEQQQQQGGGDEGSFLRCCCHRPQPTPTTTASTTIAARRHRTTTTPHISTAATAYRRLRAEMRHVKEMVTSSSKNTGAAGSTLRAAAAVGGHVTLLLQQQQQQQQPPISTTRRRQQQQQNVTATALHFAAYYNLVGAAKLFLDEGADPWARDGEGGENEGRNRSDEQGPREGGETTININIDRWSDTIVEIGRTPIDYFSANAAATAVGEATTPTRRRGSSPRGEEGERGATGGRASSMLKFSTTMEGLLMASM